MSSGEGEPAGASALRGLRLAMSLLTIVPAGRVSVDRRAAGVAMLVAPVIGAVLGASAGALTWAGGECGVGPLVAAVGAVALLAAWTRGLHLDGLADTADALGSQAATPGRSGRERALAVMKAPDIGPFGVVTLILVLLGQIAAVASLIAHSPDHHLIVLLALAGAIGRLPLAWACRTGARAARPDGLGALVAGSVPLAAAGVLTAALLGGAALAGAATDVGVGRAVLAVLLAAGVAALLLRRARLRFGGITGDVLGALVETATTVALVVLATT
ncbi:MAG: adenosylcobinamide-GDP ribazoletransferase [Sporichthyaceae bacterium]